MRQRNKRDGQALREVNMTNEHRKPANSCKGREKRGMVDNRHGIEYGRKAKELPKGMNAKEQENLDLPYLH